LAGWPELRRVLHLSARQRQFMIFTVVLDPFASERQLDDLHGFFEPG